jgi:serine/threonine protein kinase
LVNYNKHRTGIIVGVTVGASVALIALVILAFFYRRGVIFKRFKKIRASLEKIQQSGTPLLFFLLHIYLFFAHIDIEPYEITFCEKLGSGSHSDVYKAMFRGTDVAVKVMNEHYFTNNSDLSRFKLEVTIMWYAFYYFIFIYFYYLEVNLFSFFSGLRHPNIVLFMGSVVLDEHPFALQTESCPSTPTGQSTPTGHSTPPLGRLTHSKSQSTNFASRHLTPTKSLLAASKNLLSASKSQNYVNNAPTDTHACIVMEFMGNGSLSDLLARGRVASNCNNRFVLSFPSLTLYLKLIVVFSYEINNDLSVRFPDFLLFRILIVLIHNFIAFIILILRQISHTVQQMVWYVIKKTKKKQKKKKQKI